MGRRYRMTVAAMDLSKAGREGLVGAVSAKDGAKRGPQERLLPSPTNPTRPAWTQDPVARARWRATRALTPPA